MRLTLSFVLFLTIHFASFAQANNRKSSAEIQHELEKLAVIGNVMYFAAHPDDENTRLISWLANEGKYRTSYLSLTRGDGGQNLIGNEKGPFLGMLRTQELLGARSIDGGEQYFTRAIDFGYSKSADETFEKWEEEQLIADAVYNIRKFKPDVIITRFPPDSRAGHGHHTASAIIAQKAFDAASNPKKYPESAELFGTWKVRRLFFNTHPWFDKEIDQKRDRLIEINVGAYNPLLGATYTEIAAEARSQHRCQAFGTAKERENKIEYVELIAGDPLVDKNMFDGINTDWSRVPDAERIQELINHLISDFNHSQPEASLTGLYQLYSLIRNLDDNPWKEDKLNQVAELIVSCSGMWVEFLSDEEMVVRNSKFPTRIEMVSAVPMSIKSVALGDIVYAEGVELKDELLVYHDTLQAPEWLTNPYWLAEAPDGNFFTISNPDWLGLAQNRAPFLIDVVIETEYMPIHLQRPLEYKWTDRARGELYSDVNFIPAATAHINNPVYLLPTDTSASIQVRITAHADMDSLIVMPELTKAWTSDTDQVVLHDLKKGIHYDLTFKVRTSKSELIGTFSALMKASEDDEGWRNDLITIDYDHIHPQVLMPVNQARLVRSEIAISGERIGYIMGAGDEIPEMLRLMGYEVIVFDPKTISLEELQSYDAVITGIRAYNTVEEMAALHPTLMTYVENGGILVSMYNTSYSLISSDFGPYPLKIGRGRVTEEDARPVLLQKDNPLFKYPNAIDEETFDGWVQERGLYFIEEWDEHYTPLIGWADKESERLDGSLLYTPYGEGRFVYTSISFFRQLPAGVPGAFQLLANLLAQSKPIEDGE